MNKIFKNLKVGLEQAIAHQQGKIRLTATSIKILNRAEKQTIKLGNFQDLLATQFTKEELAEISREAKIEAAALRAMQQNVNNLFESYMQEHNLSLEALAAKLHVTPKRISKIQKGQTNISLGSLALLFTELGKELVGHV